MHKIRTSNCRSKAASKERGLSETKPRMAVRQRQWQNDQLDNDDGNKGARVRDLREKGRKTEREIEKKYKNSFTFLMVSERD